MSLKIQWQDVSGIERLTNALGRLQGAQKQLVLQRAVNHTGDKARTKVIRVLTNQTGLPYGVIKKALKDRRARGTSMSKTSGTISVHEGASLAYEIRSEGGDISLKFFKARETRAGVTASPFGERRLFPGAFTKGGRFPNRIVASSLNGHVYKRTGKDRNPLELLNSGVTIPQQMVTGASAKAFTQIVNAELPKRVLHEIAYLVPGIFT